MAGTREGCVERFVARQHQPPLRAGDCLTEARSTPSLAAGLVASDGSRLPACQAPRAHRGTADHPAQTEHTDGLKERQHILGRERARLHEQRANGLGVRLRLARLHLTVLL